MEIEKKHIVIIGTGKVAHQLGQQLFRVGHSINGVWGRDITKAKNLAKKLNSDVIDDLKKISKDSLALICVSDSAISEIVSSISDDVKMAYTSGSEIGRASCRERV